MARTHRDLIEDLKRFRDARDWRQFHTVKNLIGSVAIEAGELLQTIQWKSDQDTEKEATESPLLDSLQDEAADVFIYLLLLADRLGIDLVEAAYNKVAINEVRYPAASARGKAKKYTEL